MHIFVKGLQLIKFNPKGDAVLTVANCELSTLMPLLVFFLLSLFSVNIGKLLLKEIFEWV